MTVARRKKDSAALRGRTTAEFLMKGWPEAEVVHEPLKAKDLKEPTVLVKRRQPLILGSRGEELIHLTGEPVISLFTGAGGFDLGMEQAGFCCLCQVEWDEMCCQTLIGNRPNAFRHSALIQGDISKVPTSMILREANLRVGEATLLIGGPPCQGFSTSGRREVGDKRNDLVFEYLRVVREAQPRFFAFENVPGFTDLNKGSYMKAFLESAHGCYYELVYGLVNACEYGVPQDRTRFICMGTRRDLVECDGKLASLPAPETFARRDLDKIKEYKAMPLYTPDVKWLRRAPGIRYFPDRPVLTPPRPCSNAADGRGRSETFRRFYDRLEREEPDRLVFAPQGDVA